MSIVINIEWLFLMVTLHFETYDLFRVDFFFFFFDLFDLAFQTC